MFVVDELKKGGEVTKMVTVNKHSLFSPPKFFRGESVFVETGKET
jgi:hypothetical protein